MLVSMTTYFRSTAANTLLVKYKSRYPPHVSPLQLMDLDQLMIALISIFFSQPW